MAPHLALTRARRPSGAWRNRALRAKDTLYDQFAELHRLGVTIAATGVLIGFFVAVVAEKMPGGGQFIALLLVVFAARTRRSDLKVWVFAVAAVIPAWNSSSSSLGSAIMVGCLIFLGIVLAPERLHWVPIVAAVVAGLAPPNMGDFGYVSLPHNSTFAAAIGLTLGIASRRAAQREHHLRVRTEASESHAVWLEQRTALARELHDVVGHHVTAMVIQAEAGRVSDPRSALTRIADLGRTALVELDALVVHLRDPQAAANTAAPPRLADINPALTAPLTQSGIAVDVDVEETSHIGEVVELAAYRIVQEGLTNVLKHAVAQRVWVVVRVTDSHLRLSVLDDGRGPGPGAGSGLTGINERVTSLGGFWEFAARPGGGSQLDAFLPLPQGTL